MKNLIASLLFVTTIFLGILPTAGAYAQESTPEPDSTSQHQLLLPLVQVATDPSLQETPVVYSSSVVTTSGIITTIAGSGAYGPGTGSYKFIDEGAPATAAHLFAPADAKFGPDGSLYIADYSNYLIRRVDANGSIYTYAGYPNNRTCRDGSGIYLPSAIVQPYSLAFGPDGSLYVSEGGLNGGNRVRRIGTTGSVTTIAGIDDHASCSLHGNTGDGGSASQALLNQPHGLAFGPDGSLYVADFNNNRVRRIWPGSDGIITPDDTITNYAGSSAGTSGFSGDGGLATAAKLYQPDGLAFGPDGALYIADAGNRRVRRVGPDGIITTFAGNGLNMSSGDGGPATLARLGITSALAFGADGSLYIGSRESIVRRVAPNGIISTVAGTGLGGFSGDGGPAIQAKLYGPSGLTLGSDGSLYIADSTNNRIRKVIAR